jgi:hypothetical protein
MEAIKIAAILSKKSRNNRRSKIAAILSLQLF